jgi:hypothetical protein
VTKDIFQSQSEKGKNLVTEKNKTEKKSKERRRKAKYLVGNVVVTVSTLIQMTIGFSAWSEKYGSTKHVTMRWL